MEVLAIFFTLIFVVFILPLIIVANNKSKSTAVQLERQQLVLEYLRDGTLENLHYDIEGVKLKLLKQERIVFVWEGVNYFTRKTSRVTHSSGSSSGGFRGVSVPLGKGFRANVGGYRGSSNRTSESYSVEDFHLTAHNGYLFLTTHHLRYISGQRNFRIPLNKILTMSAGKRTFIVTRDTPTGKPEMFSIGDGPFALEVIDALEGYLEASSV